MKKIIKTINGHDIEMTSDQVRELELTGCVIVGDRIVRSAAFIRRVQDGAKEEIQKTAKRLFE